MRFNPLSRFAIHALLALTFACAARAAENSDNGIPPQSLRSALREFALRNDVQIVYLSEFSPDVRSRGASPGLSLHEALTQLLLNTGLRYEFINDRTVWITKIDRSGQTGDIRTRANGVTAQDVAPPEIVVTARRRQEMLRDVPESIAVFSAREMEARSMVSLQDLGLWAPNLSFYNTASFGRFVTSILIRGVGQVNSERLSDMGVGVYIDGIYLGRPEGLDIDLLEVERIEVLRGPQGTLFGRNTTGGAINVVTVEPTGEFGGDAEVTVGNYGRVEGKLRLGLPLLPGKLAATVAVVSRNRDGWGKILDFRTGATLAGTGDTNRDAARAVLYWTPTGTFSAKLSMDGTRAREAGEQRDIVAFFTPPLIADAVNSIVDPPYGDVFLTPSHSTSYASGPNYSNLDTRRLALTLAWRLGPVQIKSFTGTHKFKGSHAVDPDGSPYTLIEAVHRTDADQFSQDLQISGTSLLGRLNWTGGVYFFKERSHETSITDLLLMLGPDFSIEQDEDQDNSSSAIYGEGTYFLSDRLSLTAGLRNTSDEKSSARKQWNHRTGSIYPGTFARRSAGFDATTGRLGLEYRWNEQLMTYLSAASGYRSGGINSTGMTTEPYRPEYVWSYEFGLKSELFNRRLRLNVALFHSDHEDIQFEVTRADEVTLRPITVIGNFAKARLQGFELDTHWMLLDGLAFTMALGLTDAKYVQTDPVSVITTTTRFEKVPKWSGTLSAEYVHLLGAAASLTGRLDYAYKSEFENSTPSSIYTHQDAYGVVNARLTYAQGRWEAAAFGTNLTDERYSVGGAYFEGLGFADLMYARPREWGLTVKYSF